MSKQLSPADKKAVELMFQRPSEPIFYKRDDGKSIYDVPSEFFTDEYKDRATGLQNRLGENVDVKIPVRNITKPDIGFAKRIGKKQLFSLFLEEHQQIAGRLIKLLLDQENFQNFIATAAYIKDRLNPFLFQYVYEVAVQHRDDTKEIDIPPIAEKFPTNFVEPSVFRDARAEGTLIENPGDRMHIEIPRNFTASDREPEQRLYYFREDIGVNMHHWHWHLVYPNEGPPEVVNKDRRGELFYYMHHQILARYNAERFCNLLPKLKNLSNLREPIAEGYFPKIISSLNNRTYPSRNNDIVLKDIERDNVSLEIAQIQRWVDRILQAIDQGYVTDEKGTNIPLDEEKGIDILGNLIEASALSVNKQLYGNLHNMGHNALALAHDPDSRHLEDFSVMGDVTTAMRDPVFYRWHGMVDSVFSKHKSNLKPYTDDKLGYNGVTVENLSVKIDTTKPATENVILTFWQKSDVDLAAGLDFGPEGNVYARFTHLQHTPYIYTIQVDNQSGSAHRGTCRIFMCPQSDERGAALSFNEQRNLMIEMDKFTVNLNPGKNTIRRRSDESSVTIPFERSFRRIGEKYQPTDQKILEEFRFCGCGWPQHMLVPRGTPEGMNFDLYCMISNYDDDAVEQKNNEPDVCGDAHSFCGLKDKLYPDKRAMGFPFDRRSTAATLDEFVNAFSNMTKQIITIKYNNQIIDRF